MRSNKELIDSLISEEVLKDPRIKKALLTIDRSEFVPEVYESLRYVDIALPIGREQTISQPYTVAFMLELLDVREGHSILDLGSGSGWTTALLAELVGPDGFVTGIEIIPELVEMGRENLDKFNVPNAEIVEAQSKVLGIPGEKFDRILVSASAKRFPEELFGQLKSGGIMVLPVLDSIYRVEKQKDGSMEQVGYYGFRFVDLV